MLFEPDNYKGPLKHSRGQRSIQPQRVKNHSFEVDHTYITFFYQHQEPITQSFQLPYLPSVSTLSHIFLFSEAPSTGFFACDYIIANHKRAVVIYCLCHMQVTWKYINNGKKHGKSACFHRKLKNPSHISVLKLKRYGTGLTEGCNWFGSCCHGNNTKKLTYVLLKPFIIPT